MCRFKSGLVTRDGRVLHVDGLDSHEDLVQHFKLRDDGIQHFVRVEAYPASAADMFDPEKYVLHLDEAEAPGWWGVELAEVARKGLAAAVDGMLKRKSLKVGGSLYLNGCTGLKALPESLKVGGYLYLDGCTGLKALPESLRQIAIGIPEQLRTTK